MGWAVKKGGFGNRLSFWFVYFWEQVGACWGQTPPDSGLGRFNELNVQASTSKPHTTKTPAQKTNLGDLANLERLELAEQIIVRKRSFRGHFEKRFIIILLKYVNIIILISYFNIIKYIIMKKSGEKT